MAEYRVGVSRTIEVYVDVEADDPEEAAEVVNDADYELPPLDEWQGGKDWRFVVYDPQTDEELYVEE